MKHSVSSILLVVLLFLLATYPLAAQDNGTYCRMAYKGILTDNTGRPASDTIHSITIQIYNDPQSQTPIWQDEFITATQGGVFSVILGSQRLFPNLTTMRLWIRVSTGTGKPDLLPFSGAVVLMDEAITIRHSINISKSKEDFAKQSVKLNLDLAPSIGLPTYNKILPVEMPPPSLLLLPQ